MSGTPVDPMMARAQLIAYLNFIDEQHHNQKRTKPTDSKLRRIAKQAVPVKLRSRTRFLVTDALTPFSRVRARRILERHAGSDLRLHIGSGGEPKEGWINVDLVGDPVELPWNLKRGLPFPDGCVAAIFSEHLLEHIPLPGVVATLRECLRVLEPRGILRIGVPDAGTLLSSYTSDNATFIEQTRAGRPTRMLAVQELFYWYEHCTMYDEETLRWLLAATGFSDEVTRCSPGESGLLVAAPDTERRFAETLYLETARPPR